MLRAGRELDLRVAQDLLGYVVVADGEEYYESTPKGNRLLPHYSSDMGAAWEVAEKMSVTLIPISDGSWFALAGRPPGWNSPADFVAYLGKGDYVQGGAAVNRSAALSICIAALSARAKVEMPALQNMRGPDQNSSLH